MRRSAALFALALLATPAALPSAAAADDPPICISRNTFVTHVATKWRTTAGTLIGTPGDDVLVGSLGADKIHGLGGNDTGRLGGSRRRSRRHRRRHRPVELSSALRELDDPEDFPLARRFT